VEVTDPQHPVEAAEGVNDECHQDQDNDCHQQADQLPHKRA
jgi:hypothetical protein